MKRIIFTFLTILQFTILTSQSKAWDSTAAKYFPLNVGNVWIYSVQSFPPPQFPYIIYKIEGDTIINSYRYFLYNRYYNSILTNSSLIRYDSLNGNLLVYSSTGGCSNYANDKIIDSLSSTPGNLVTCQIQSIYTRLCISISDITVFNGYQTQRKQFEHDGLTYGITNYAKGFGIISSCSGEPPPCSSSENLKGCIINGIFYGDTVLTNVHQISSAIPEKFSLSQNYPNPFNPKTKLEFGISDLGFVSLKVFNMLGKEVATLVNEKLNPGNYSVEFNGEGLPSGVYFYKLEAGSFVETKRMVLLK